MRPFGKMVRRWSTRTQKPKLLRNAAMAGPDGEPAEWETYGPVTYSAAEVGADDAVRRIRLGVGAYLVQSVAVMPDTLYALEAEAASRVPGARARLLTEWVDARGRTIDYTTWRQVAVGPEWMRYAMACTAPPEARLVKIWLMAVIGGDVMFRPHFYELR